jgi:flagellar FliL protein
MSASPDIDQPPADGEKKRSLPAFVPVVLAVVVGIAAGGAGGAFFVGPLLAEGIAPKTAATAAPAGDHGGEGAEEGEEEQPAAEGKEGEGAAAKPVYTIDNLVLNPAQSGGTRFLLLTIAFELKDDATLEEMKTRDAELRDAVLVTVGAKSVEYLSDMAVRDTLKGELKSVAGKLFPKKKNAIHRIYFPQFVIQ